MSITRDSVITEFEARIAGYVRDVQRAAAAFERSQSSQAAASKRATQSILADQKQVQDGIRNLGAAVAAAFTGRELVQSLDQYTRLQNALRVAGLEGEQLTAVQDRLLASAQRSGAGVTNLAGLYSSLSTLQKDLGLSSENVLRLTDAVANSIKVSGGSAEQSAGAILGLNQALAQGRVQGDEYNQILDGLRPLLQAAVDASDKYKGSLNALRRDILDTGLSGAQLYGIIEQGTALLSGRAEKANLTVAQSLNALSDSFSVYFSEAGGGVEISQALGTALRGIADNLNILAPAIGVLAVVIGSRYVAAAIAGAGSSAALSAAIFAVQARAGAAATSMEALAFAGRAAGASLLSVFGGPVGAAITAVGIAIGFAVLRTDELTDATNRARAAELESSTAKSRAIDLSRRRAAAVGDEVKAIEALIQADLVLAKNRAAQARESVRTSKAKFDAAKREFDAVKGGDDAQSRGVRSESAKRAQAAFSDVSSAFEILRATNETVGLLSGNIKPTQRTFSGPTAKEKKGPKGPSAETLAKRAEAARIREVRDDFAFERDFNSARQADLQAQRDLATSTEKRLELDQMLISIVQDQVNAELQRDGPNGTKKFSDAQVKQLTVLNDQTALNRRTLAILQSEQEQAQRALDVSSAANRDKAELLQIESQLAETSAERLAIELRLIDLQFQEETARLEAVRASQLSTDAERQIAAARIAALPGIKAASEQQAKRSNEGPLAQFRREANLTKDDLERIQVDGIQRLSDGLADVITKSKSLKSVFKDVANSIINDLIRIGIQQAIVAAFGGGGGGGSSGGGIGSALGSIFGGARANGGPISAGKAYLVGERGPEIVLPRSNGLVVPNNQIVPLSRGGSVSGGAGGATIRVVLSSDLVGTIDQRSASMAIQIVNEAAPQIRDATVKAMTKPRQNG